MKKVQDLNIEDLLKELENSSDEKNFRTDGQKNDVLTFLNVFNLKSGKTPILPRVLHKLYKVWSRTPVSSKMFAYTLKASFVVSDDNVLIDEESFKIKREDWVYFYSGRTKRVNREHFWKKHFEMYLARFAIKPGTIFINFNSFLLLYTRFVNQPKRRGRIMAKDRFITYLRLHFKEKITEYSSYFAVSNEIWKVLDKEIYNEKEKDQKKFKKISRTYS